MRHSWQRKTLVCALTAMIGLASVRAQTPASPPGAPSPEGRFVLTPDAAEKLFDPRDFQLNDSQVLIGKDQADRMTLPVQIGGGTYDFLIDTGSQRTIVATELAQRLALPELPPVQIVSIAGKVTVSSVALAGLKFGDHVVENLEALSIKHDDLGSAGLIGLDSLQDKRVTLDFKQRRMNVGQSRRGPAKASDPETIVVQARSKLGQLILVNSRIDGKRVSVILDTGAEMSVGNMALFRSLQLKKLLIPPQPTVLTSVTGVPVAAQYTVVKHIMIGQVTLNNVPMVFLDAAPFAELDLGDKPAMLLGMRMLRLFDRVAIDFGNRRIDFRIREGAERAGVTRLANADLRLSAFAGH